MIIHFFLSYGDPVGKRSTCSSQSELPYYGKYMRREKQSKIIVFLKTLVEKEATQTFRRGTSSLINGKVRENTNYGYLKMLGTKPESIKSPKYSKSELSQCGEILRKYEPVGFFKVFGIKQKLERSISILRETYRKL